MSESTLPREHRGGAVHFDPVSGTGYSAFQADAPAWAEAGAFPVRAISTPQRVLALKGLLFVAPP